MEKRYKIIEIKEQDCKYKEYNMTEYQDGYSDFHILCKVNNEICDEEHCNHKQLQLEGFTKEEMIEKMTKAMCCLEGNCRQCPYQNKENMCKEFLTIPANCGYNYYELAEATLKALLEDK